MCGMQLVDVQTTRKCLERDVHCGGNGRSAGKSEWECWHRRDRENSTESARSKVLHCEVVVVPGMSFKKHLFKCSGGRKWEGYRGDNVVENGGCQDTVVVRTA